MQDYRLPRTGKPPLAFHGDLIVSQSFVEESPCYLDAEGRVRFGKATWTWTVALYRSSDGRFVYHDHTAMNPPIQPEQHAARFEEAKEHGDSLAQMETLRRCPAFVAGPLSLGASGGPL